MPQTSTKALQFGATAVVALSLTACGGDDVSAEELEQMIMDNDDTLEEVDCEPLEREHGSTSECDVESTLIVTATFNEEDNAVDFSSMWGEDSVDLED